MIARRQISKRGQRLCFKPSNRPSDIVQTSLSLNAFQSGSENCPAGRPMPWKACQFERSSPGKDAPENRTKICIQRRQSLRASLPTTLPAYSTDWWIGLCGITGFRSLSSVQSCCCLEGPDATAQPCALLANQAASDGCPSRHAGGDIGEALVAYEMRCGRWSEGQGVPKIAPSIMNPHNRLAST